MGILSQLILFMLLFILGYGFYLQWWLLPLFFIGLALLALLLWPHKGAGLGQNSAVKTLLIFLGIFLVTLSFVLQPYFPLALLLSLLGLWLWKRKNLVQGKRLQAYSPPPQKNRWLQLSSWFGYHYLEVAPKSDLPADVSLFGERLVDLSPLLLSPGQHNLSFLQVYGRLKIIVPPGLGVEARIHGFRTVVAWQDEQYGLNNKMLYLTHQAAKEQPLVALQIYQLYGDVEVVFL